MMYETNILLEKALHICCWALVAPVGAALVLYKTQILAKSSGGSQQMLCTTPKHRVELGYLMIFFSFNFSCTYHWALRNIKEPQIEGWEREEVDNNFCLHVSSECSPGKAAAAAVEQSVPHFCRTWCVPTSHSMLPPFSGDAVTYTESFCSIKPHTTSTVLKTPLAKSSTTFQKRVWPKEQNKKINCQQEKA